MTANEKGVSEPRFGEADLSNCEREQIHLPGSIQPHGALLVLDEHRDLRVSRASANAAEMLCSAGGQSLIGRPLSDIGVELAGYVGALASEHALDIPAVATTGLGDGASEKFDCVVHRSAPGQLIVEFERASEDDPALAAQLRSGIEAISAAASLQSLCDVTAQVLKQMLGHSRVMVYRFDPDGHGHVFAEQRDADLEAYLGNHYPASDIPKIARDLYLKTRVRMLVDVDYTPVPVLPQNGPESASALDMSLCHLRSMSPMHLQYLRNMGVASTLVASLALGGSLWGLIACHDATPRQPGFSARAATELIAEVVATRISALESVTQTRVERAIKRLDENMIDLVAHDGDWPKALFDNAQGFLQAFDATGAALTYDGEIVAIGTVPSHAQIRQLTAWLDTASPDSMFQTPKLGVEIPALQSVSELTPGVLAVPVSRVGGEYLICFRPEKVRTIVWGGDPRKPVESDGDGPEISPRSSFAQWREQLKDTAVPWTPTDVSAGHLIGKSIRDLIHQIRAVRALIAHSQVETLMEQLERSDIPGLIANAEGEILLANEALGALLWQNNPAIEQIGQIARFFEESSLASHSLHELLTRLRPWRGLATLDSKPVLVRADPVPSPEGETLGFVVLLTEVGESLVEQEAKIPKAVLEGFPAPAADMPEPIKAQYASLAAAVLENAQLAALEIKDGADVARVTRMLESVEDSVSRTSRLIGNLVAHSLPVGDS